MNPRLTTVPRQLSRWRLAARPRDVIENDAFPPLRWRSLPDSQPMSGAHARTTLPPLAERSSDTWVLIPCPAKQIGFVQRRFMTRGCDRSARGLHTISRSPQSRVAFFFFISRGWMLAGLTGPKDPTTSPTWHVAKVHSAVIPLSG